MFRIIGALSHQVPVESIYAGLNAYAGSKPENYGESYDLQSYLSNVGNYRLVFVGEIHSQPILVQLQKRIVQAMKRNTQGRLHIVMEHFSFDMQHLLDQYQKGKLTFEQLEKEYHAIGTEGHKMSPYKSLLEYARDHDVKLHAGFVSRTHARRLVTKQIPSYKYAAKWPVYHKPPGFEGSSYHYNLFESMISGRPSLLEPPSERFRPIFQAQLLKDTAMAHKINLLLRNIPQDDKVVVICGNGHVAHYQGVPERVLRKHPSLLDQTCLVTCHFWNFDVTMSSCNATECLDKLGIGSPGTNPADYVFVYAR